jgi:hypothetical protein
MVMLQILPGLLGAYDMIHCWNPYQPAIKGWFCSSRSSALPMISREVGENEQVESLKMKLEQVRGSSEIHPLGLRDELSAA